MRFSTLGFDDKKIDTLDATLEFEKLRNDNQERDKEKDDETDLEREDSELEQDEDLEIERT